MNSVVNFYFYSQWQLALSGLGGLQGALQGIAYTILGATLIMGIYERMINGGSFSGLGVTLFKYCVAAGVINYWNTFFNDVVSTGVSVATSILGGNADVIGNFYTDLQSYFATTGFQSLLFNGFSGLATSIVFGLVVLVAVVLFFGFLKLFTLIFIFWGGVLYCFGPLMISLSPSGLVGNYAGQYCKNLAEWALWPAIYATFATLMVAINSASVAQVLNQNQNTYSGLTQQTTGNALWLAVMSLLYGVCVILTPLIAHLVIKGDFSGVANAGIRMARMASSIATGGTTAAAGAVSGGGSGIVSTSLPSSAVPAMPPPRS